MAANGSPENGSDSLNSFTGGKLFDTVFAKGMALVEETASYLDGLGRDPVSYTHLTLPTTPYV